MKKQYFRRLLALAVTFVLLFAESAASAFYEPGGTSVSLGDIDLSAGTTSYEFNLTVDTKSLTFTAPASATVTLSTGQQTVTLTESGTVTFPQVERKGARCWEFTSEAPITLSNVVAVSYDNPELSGYDSTMEAPVCALSDNEMAVSTALLVNRNASCIIVGGARRYINYDDAKEVPAMIDGSMYLPGRALALALGCYYESIPGKNYVFIRDDEQAREFYFTTEGCYEQTERGEKLPIPFHPVYKEGNVYLPVRCFAELLGKTVAYRDGIAMVDDYYSVQKMQTSGVFSYINSLFAGFTPTEGTGNTYHVAQTASASDDNLGSFSQPWRTLKKAAAEAEAGDTVIIHKGVYREVLAPQNDGTATNPIIFRAAENEKVVISATKPVSGFTTREDGLLTAPVPVDLGEGRNQVFYNGACIIEARYPDGPGIEMSENGEALSDLFPVWGDMQVQDRTEEEKTAGITRVTSENLLQEEEADYWKGAFYLSVHGYSYALMPARVASSKKGELTLTDTEDLYWRYDPKTNKTWNFGYISGHINAINQPGEWVVQDGQLIIKPPAGETAATLQVEMKADQLTMDLTDREFVQVIGVETLGGSAKLKDSEMCVLSDVDMQYISHYTYSVDQREGYIDDNSKAMRTSGNGAPQRGEVGVYVGGKDNAVINSRIDHSAAAGLYLAGLYAYVDNNIISNCGYMGSYVCGITAYPEPWTEYTAPRGGFAVYNNTVYNAGRHPFKIQSNSGIWTNGDTRVPFLPFELAYNDFHDGNLFTLDTGMVYAYCMNAATEKARSRIHSNYMYSTTPESNPYSFGLYFDGGALGMDGYNNVIFTTEPDTRFTHSYAFNNRTSSNSTHTNNAKLIKPVTGGAAALAADQFPKGKPFYAGALQNAAPYLKNYEQLDETATWYAAEDATLSGNYVLHDDGGISLADTTATICFPDIDFSGDVNQLLIYFGGDRYTSGNVMRVVVADSPDSADRSEFVLRTRADELYEMDMQTVYTGEIEGTKNVYITARSAAPNTRIYGLMPSADGKAAHDPHDSTDMQAAEFDYIQTIDSSSAGYTQVSESQGTSYVMNTRSGTTLVYKNVTVSEAADWLKIAVSQGASSVPSRNISIYADSLTYEGLLVTYNNVNSEWIDTTVKSAQLNKTLQPGTYDIYVKFTGGNTSNFFSFGFLPENPLA